MFARPSSVKLVGQYFIMFDCSFHEHDFFCSTDLGAIKHIFNGVLNFRYLYRLVSIGDMEIVVFDSFLQVGWLEIHPGHLKFSPR